MEEIKIFHSFRKNVFLLFGGAIFAVGGIFALLDGANLWFCLISVIFFGCFFLFVSFLFVKEWLTGKAYLVISDQSLTINDLRERVILFSDVASFEVGEAMISVNYKKGKGTNQQISIFKKYVIEFGDGFNVEGLTWKPEQICELLNRRLGAT